MALIQDKATFPWIVTSQKVLGSTQATQPQSGLSSINNALEKLIDNDVDLDSRVAALEGSGGTTTFIGLTDTPGAHVSNQVLTNNGSGIVFEAKNTGFNKNFGTTAGTVAEGNHIHDDRYYTETELNTSGGGGQVHVDNIIGGGITGQVWKDSLKSARFYSFPSSIAPVNIFTVDLGSSPTLNLKVDVFRRGNIGGSYGYETGEHVSIYGTISSFASLSMVNIYNFVSAIPSTLAIGSGASFTQPVGVNGGFRILTLGSSGTGTIATVSLGVLANLLAEEWHISVEIIGDPTPSSVTWLVGS